VKILEKFTANYAKTSRNFVIQNLKGDKKIYDKYYPIFCVLKNLLHRGCPTIMSEYLQDKIGKLHLSPDFSNRLIFIDKNVPKWEHTIKGNSEKGEYPALEFFEKEIPKHLEEYRFIQQLLWPEVLFSDITEEFNEEFIDQQVDFYLPQAKLVIEIDGQQHKRDNVTRINDKYRDKYLCKYRVLTIRIDTIDMYKQNSKYLSKIKVIKKRLKEYDNHLNYYKEQYNSPSYYDNEFNNKVMTAVATIRFQTAILCLLERGSIKLTDKYWNFNILSRDAEGFAEFAIEDIFIWLKHLCKLNKIEYLKPEVNIKYCKDIDEFSYDEDEINIDISLLRRWTDENINHPNIIFIRNDYKNHTNYFKVSTSDPIKYNIINDGEDSDIPSLEFMLRNLFGFDEFRDGQLPIIINSLSYNDTIGLLPTGTGKSLCYQLVALLQPCINFVVCPIKSLMYDQKYNTNKRYITNTNYITGDQNAKEKNKVGQEFSEGRYNFIWISPERFQIPDFRDYLEKLNKEQTIALAVIDEVHCLSEWGHDFRTSYLNLIKTIRNYCPSSALLGLTATASSFVLEDLKNEFEIGSDNIKTTLFSRPELNFYVEKDNGKDIYDKKTALFNLIRNLDKKHEIFKKDPNNVKSGLIFTPHVNGKLGCYKLSQEITSKFKINAKWYSGKIPKKNKTPIMSRGSFDNYKKKVQDEFQDNKFPLLVATKAFGMGIDKENIRYTIHNGMPNSLESLYQEAGRAGRDKNDAYCYVLYSKENLSDSELDILFHPESTVSKIKEIHDKKKYEEAGDVLRNFFFWLKGNKGIEYEFKLMNSIYKNYAKLNTKKLIECDEKLYKFDEVQKSIYKLSLLGVIGDWTIKSWNKNREIIEVQFENIDDESIFKALINYIKKYDKEFSLSEENSINQKYVSIYNKKYLKNYEKSIKILLEWGYDNIVYNRRQSIKNILELCDEYSEPDIFKARIESYFKFTEKTYMLDHIAQNPMDFTNWFQIFYEEYDTILDKDVNNLEYQDDEEIEYEDDDGSEFEEDYIGQFRENIRRELNLDNKEVLRKEKTFEDKKDLRKELKVVNKKDLQEIRGSITRLLESYRYNTGLNYISGMVRLLLGEFENQDGRYRLDLAFNQIIKLDDIEKVEILENTLEIGKEGNTQVKENLSEFLLQYYPNQKVKVYNSLQDNYSLMKILGDSNKTLQKVGGLFKW
jgi:ATP-dependent DNA helicase RecQ